MLTKVALDSVFAHADEKCETRTTLQNRQRKELVRKMSTKKCDRNALGGMDRRRPEHTGWVITATGLLGGCLVGGNGLSNPWSTQSTFIKITYHHTIQ